MPFHSATLLLITVRNSCSLNPSLNLALIKSEQHHKSQKANNIFKKSIINDDLANCAFDNYKATNEDLARAKALCERYANNSR